MNLELIPLLIIALLMLSVGGAEVETAEFIMEGDHEMTDHRGALIVGDATVTVPVDADIPGPVFVIGGELTVEGSVTGDVTQLSGVLVVEDDAAIDGELLYVAGTERLAEGALIADRTTVDVTPAEPDPVAAYAPIVLTALLLALVGAVLTRRRPTLLENVATATREHAVVSLTVGGLLFVTFLSVFVFMAFTLVLIPVSILGLLVGLLTIAYGVIAWGYLVGQRLNLSEGGVATAIGVVLVVVLLQVVGRIPIVGDLLVVGVLLSGLGAVVLTFYGLRQFEPVRLPE